MARTTMFVNMSPCPHSKQGTPNHPRSQETGLSGPLTVIFPCLFVVFSSLLVIIIVIVSSSIASINLSQAKREADLRRLQEADTSHTYCRTLNPAHATSRQPSNLSGLAAHSEYKSKLTFRCRS